MQLDDKNEKGLLDVPEAQSLPLKTPFYKTRYALLFKLGLLLLLGYNLGGGRLMNRVESCFRMHYWGADKLIAPLAPGLTWSACPDVTETFCSYLTVPMDYTDPQANETVSLALRMLPATVPVKQQLGYLFINPGGPGGSGHNFVVRAGKQLSVIVEGRYHIISWDPRSVNLTSPSLNCFTTSGDAERFNRDVELLGLPFEVQGGQDAQLAWTRKIDSYYRALDSACVESGNQGLLRSSSTASVARDMKRILEALGEEQLSYWGFSYGTILGATFSAMFPELVHRVLLDGVADSDAYTNRFWDWGRAGMNDTHKTWEGFLTSCAESGPKGCALAHVNSTSKEIGKRIEELKIKLKEDPLPVGKSSVGPGTVTSSQVQYAIFNALYSPKTWPSLAEALAKLEKGDGRLMYESTNSANNKLTREKDPTDNPFHRTAKSTIASTAAIMCSDTDPAGINDTSVSTFHKFTKELENISPTGAIWSIWIGTCRRWTHRAKEVYRGPWTVKDGLRKTNFPILFFSQTADPVTPLVSARVMADGFGSESASLLIQNGYGHCSLAHPSLCTAKYARTYLTDGWTPIYGTTCDADPGFLFPHPEAKATRMRALSMEDQELMKALDELAGVMGEFVMRP